MNYKQFVFALAALLFSVSAYAGAQATQTPSQALEVAINNMIEIVKSPDYSDPAKRVQLQDVLEERAKGLFDFSEFASRTLGTKWASFSEDQKIRFDDAFSDLLRVTYLNQVDGYHNEQVEYVSERLSEDKQRAEVQTTVRLASGKAIPIAYRMSFKNDTWLVYDVLAENVSLINNYRAQFREILLKNSPDELIKRVQDQVEKLQRESAKN
jgi:phospholipid transport system substrate-binding protein